MTVIRGTRYKFIKTLQPILVHFTKENHHKGKTCSEKIGKDKRNALSPGVGWLFTHFV